MACHVYTINHGQYQADIILSNRVVKAALGQDTISQRMLKRLRKPRPYRESHESKQLIVDQFSVAVAETPEYKAFMRAQAESQVAGLKSKRIAHIADRPYKVEEYQFGQLSITRKRLATPREHLWHFVLSLANNSMPLIPKSQWVTSDTSE